MSLVTFTCQVSVPWSNFYAALHGARTCVVRHRVQVNRPLSTSDVEQSLNNAISNCTELSLVSLSAVQLRSLTPTAPPVAAHWRQSHVSSPSFFQNKHGFPASTLYAAAARPATASQLSGSWTQRRGYATRQLAGRQTTRARTPAAVSMATDCRVTSPTALGGSWWRVPRREFKTERSVTRERARVPSLIDRLRPFQQSTATSEVDLEHSKKLNELLMGQSASDDDRQQMKVAFAEGYVSGTSSTHRQKDGSAVSRLAQSYRSVVRTVLTVVIIVLGVSLAGPMLKSTLQSRMGLEDVKPEIVDVSFGDVKGTDEAKQELQDIVAFLMDPERFSSLGGKLPKGVLLTGPPGTGKTLLARAVAGEAGVPFFHAAGSEFDEVFVGQGARRVRELFRVAKMRAPCVVFIDEIDSVGGKRSASRMHPYANQTINQLLTEMDGFHSNEGVIVLGATNRRDHLDVALLRPGRFDVEVVVNPPDMQGRKDIFNLYLDRVKAEYGVDVDNLARGTIGFTGADIENMVNQAALRAAVLNAHEVTMQHLDWARDKVIMGTERKSRLPDEEANLMTAYHEGGHTLVAMLTKSADPIHKVTIMPRSQSLGHTSQIPAKDQFQTTKEQLMARLDVLMGGRAAEELIFGLDHVTTGASNDLKRATQLASAMVRELGMGDALGVRVVLDNIVEDMPTKSVSDKTMDAMDAEIKLLLQDSYERAKSLLTLHMPDLKLLAEALMKHETLNAEELKELLKSKSLDHLETAGNLPVGVRAVSSN